MGDRRIKTWWKRWDKKRNQKDKVWCQGNTKKKHGERMGKTRDMIQLSKTMIRLNIGKTLWKAKLRKTEANWSQANLNGETKQFLPGESADFQSLPS